MISLNKPEKPVQCGSLNPVSGQKRELTRKEALCVEYYTNPIDECYQCWIKAYKKAGYSICKGWQWNAAKVHAKDYIKQAIEAKRRDYVVKSSISREYCVEKLQEIIDTKANSNRDIISAISLIADMSGFKKELAPNAEKLEEEAARLSEEDRKVALEVARVRTRELAKDDEPEVIKFKAG